MNPKSNWLNHELTLEIEKVAHGGIFVARHEGRVVFVNHVLPGEKVLARVYEDRGGAFCRAEPIAILTPSTHRVKHFWKEAETLGAGGAEFGHIALDYQRELKAQVLSEALQRMAKTELSVEVQPLEHDVESGGLGYRTRVQLHVDEAGVAGPYRERSHDVVPVKRLPLAVADIEELGLHLKNWQNVKRIEIAASSTGQLQWSIDKKLKGDQKLLERALDRTFRISSGGFWQVHVSAAETLGRAVGELAEAAGFEPNADNHDLYSGVGLFTGGLAQRFGAGIHATAVETSKAAIADAELNLRDLSKVRAVAMPVERYLKSLDGVKANSTFVLDPPRSGAGKEAVTQLLRIKPRHLIYVACDPIALARDLGDLLAGGYRIADARAYDLFPHTHHFETLVSLVAER
jgi:tRNA/tmRNA/rRNA uracil-C5-methylase (TrmA/RlmC/RlmD family)